jgi:hypothetical protein
MAIGVAVTTASVSVGVALWIVRELRRFGDRLESLVGDIHKVDVRVVRLEAYESVRSTGEHRGRASAR